MCFLLHALKFSNADEWLASEGVSKRSKRGFDQEYSDRRMPYNSNAATNNPETVDSENFAARWNDYKIASKNVNNFPIRENSENSSEENKFSENSYEGNNFDVNPYVNNNNLILNPQEGNSEKFRVKPYEGNSENFRVNPYEGNNEKFRVNPHEGNSENFSENPNVESKSKSRMKREVYTTFEMFGYTLQVVDKVLDVPRYSRKNLTEHTVLPSHYSQETIACNDARVTCAVLVCSIHHMLGLRGDNTHAQMGEDDTYRQADDTFGLPRKNAAIVAFSVLLYPEYFWKTLHDDVILRTQASAKVSFP